MTIGMRIKKRRNELKLTQEQLGEKLGITKSAICKVERDKEQNLTTERVETFAEALDCSVQYLMGWEEEVVDVPSYDEDTMELIDLFSKITKEQKQTVLEMLRSFMK